VSASMRAICRSTRRRIASVSTATRVRGRVGSTGSVCGNLNARSLAESPSTRHLWPWRHRRHGDVAPREAIRIIYSATHSCAEGAGAAALAAVIKERERLQGRRVAVILSGQNIDRPWMQTVLAGDTPRVG
jgi:hypothetical protein